MGTIVEDARARIEETRGKLKTRIDEWRERGWRRPEGSSSSSNPRFPIVKEIREKGVASAVRARREARIARRGGGLFSPKTKSLKQTPQSPEEIAIEERVVPRVEEEVALEL